jgi:hypothetical protein
MSTAREDRLSDPHVLPLMEVVHGLRARGLDVLNVDPNDGGVNARVLFLLDTPGPRAVGSRYVSRDNPDPTAKNMGRSWDIACFDRSDAVLWNVVPYCVSTVDRNGKTTVAQVCASVPDTQAFVDQLRRLAVVVFCGRKAQRAIGLLRLPVHVQVLKTWHTGDQAYNRPAYRADIHETFKQARRLISEL